MGENDVTENDTTEISYWAHDKKAPCSYCSRKRDCDGDYDNYCMSDDSCKHKRNVRDCDGDIISLCRR